MPLRFSTFCAITALAAGLSACAGISEPARTAAASRPVNDATTAEALARIAQKSLDAGDPVSAVSMLKRAHEINPTAPTILAELGRTLGALNAWTEAAEAYRKAASLAPTDAAIRRGYGGALLTLDQPELAEQEYRGALAASQDATSFTGLGVALDLQGRHEEAEAAFRKAYQIDPKSSAARANLALSLALWGSTNEAIELLAPLAAAPDAVAKQRQNLALVFGLAGELDQAAAVARIDLGEEAVRSNLAYYETLHALPPMLRVRALMGGHTQPLQPVRKPDVVSVAEEPAPKAMTPAPAVTPSPKPEVAKPARTAERAKSSRISRPVADKVEAKTDAVIAPGQISTAAAPISTPTEASAVARSNTKNKPSAVGEPEVKSALAAKATKDGRVVEHPVAADKALKTFEPVQIETPVTAAEAAPTKDNSATVEPTEQAAHAVAETPTVLMPEPKEAQPQSDVTTVEPVKRASEPVSVTVPSAATEAAQPKDNSATVEPTEQAAHAVAETPTVLMPEPKEAQPQSDVTAVEPVKRASEPVSVTVPSAATEAAQPEDNSTTVEPTEQAAHAVAETPTVLMPEPKKAQPQSDATAVEPVERASEPVLVMAPSVAVETASPSDATP